MSRYLKAFGLALAAAFAIGAVAAAGASAVTHTFHADGKEAFLTAENDPGSSQVFKATPEDLREVVCKKVNVLGTQIGSEVSANTFGRADVTVTPEYSECNVWEKGMILTSARVNTGGCKYKFTGETTETAAGTPGLHATLHIEGCTNATEGITFEFSALNRPCIHISEQTVHGLRYNNVETGGGLKDVTVEATISGIQSDTTDFPLVCPTGGTKTHNNGTYTGKLIVKGFKEQIKNSGNTEHKTPTSISVNPG